jgi:hypothetical protein
MVAGMTMATKPMDDEHYSEEEAAVRREAR